MSRLDGAVRHRTGDGAHRVHRERPADQARRAVHAHARVPYACTHLAIVAEARETGSVM